MTRIQLLGIIGLLALSTGVLLFASAFSNIRGQDAASAVMTSAVLVVVGIVFILVAATQWLWGPWS